MSGNSRNKAGLIATGHDAAQQHRVAVGCGPRDHLDANVARGAPAVVYDVTAHSPGIKHDH